jgi:hypothetical protein
MKKVYYFFKLSVYSVPIRVEDVKRRGESIIEKLERRIIEFLKAHKGYAYTSEEIREELGLKSNIPEKDSFYKALVMVTLMIMVREGKIKEITVKDETYYYVE